MVLCAQGAIAAFGEPNMHEHFDDVVKAHFLGSQKVSYAKRKAKKEGKPLMVVITRQGCGACNMLKESVNSGSKVKERLGKFVVVNAEGVEGIEAWAMQGHGYSPQTYFYAPGQDAPLHIRSQLSTQNNLPFYLHDDANLAWAMDAALMAVKGKGHFDDVVKNHFLASRRVSHAKQKAKKEGKPLMVLITARQGCNGCDMLKESVNLGSMVKERLGNFVVVNAEGKAGMEAWAPPGHNYLPQTYFYAPGEETPLHIQTQNDDMPFFLYDDASIAWGMDTALTQVKSGSREITVYHNR
jgi:thioredoxin-related protein